MHYNVYQLLMLFLIYSFLGWCVEVSFVAVTTGRVVNRGFLNGPVCPIYGVGMLGALLLLEPVSGNLVLLFFLGMLIPSFVTEIARFKIINGLGLYNTLGAPIVIYVASDLMQLYIYRQFISTLPVSLDESALLDGCSYFGLFTRIIFPLLAPATATVVIIKAITIINDMYIPYLYMPKNKLRTLTTFLMNYANAQQGSWQNLAAGIIIIMLPTIVIYLFFQKYILAGIAAGAVKE